MYKIEFQDLIEANRHNRIDNEIYHDILKMIKHGEEAETIAKNLSFPIDTIYSIRSQEIVKDVKHRFHILKLSKGKMVRRWKHGESLTNIAHGYRFPPVLITKFVLPEVGYTRKQIESMLHNPEKIKDERLSREMTRVAEEDQQYSPTHSQIQRAEGHEGELRLAEWLVSKDIDFKTEDDLKNTSSKTPDFLLEGDLYLGKIKLAWIESKASFGSRSDYRMHLRKQLKPYRELFGPGMVVYWRGFLSALKTYDDIFISGENLFRM